MIPEIPANKLGVSGEINLFQWKLRPTLAKGFEGDHAFICHQLGLRTVPDGRRKFGSDSQWCKSKPVRCPRNWLIRGADGQDKLLNGIQGVFGGYISCNLNFAKLAPQIPSFEALEKFISGGEDINFAALEDRSVSITFS